MKAAFYVLLTALLAFGGWSLWNGTPLLGTREFHTLEVRYTANQIMEGQRSELLKSDDYTYLDPKLKFYPCLMMDVKFAKEDHSTGEGVLLWSLTDGEMVVDASTWETTHGYEDCLLAKADRHDFKIIRALVENVGMIDRERLGTQLAIESDVLDKWIDRACSKKLIVAHDNKLRLHLKNPHIESIPVTRFELNLVTIPAKQVEVAKKTYSSSQIRQLASQSFDEDFTIRRVSEVFLPVYNISIQNPDGSTLTTRWNAVNGKQLENLKFR